MRLSLALLMFSLCLLIPEKGQSQLVADFEANITAVCNGSSVIFTDKSTGSPTTWNWNFGVGATPATASGKGPHTVTYTGSGKSTVSLIVGNGILVDTETKVNYITVNALPVVTFNNILASQCLSSTTYTLSGGLPSGGTYSGPGVTGTNFNASVAGVGIHIITYTYTDGNGCVNSATNTITVIVNPLPPTGPTPQNFCTINNPTVASLEATGLNIRWYLTASGGIPLATTTPLVGGIYYASQTVGGCESVSRLAVTVTINNPVAPTGTSPQNFCAINNPTVANLTATGTGIKWYLTSTGGTPLATTTALANGIYYASQTVGGCESVSRLAVTVTISNPAAPTGTSPQNFCAINNPTVANLTATGTGIQWYLTSTGGTPLATTTVLANGIYYASQTVGGCESVSRLAVTVTVSNPAAPIGPSPQNFCAINNPTVANLTATGTGIKWYLTSTGGTPLATTTAIANGIYYASQTLGGCESVSRLAVTVLISDPAAPIGPSPQNFCTGNNPTVTNLTATGTGIKWYLTSTGGTPLATTTALANGTYYASQTVGVCESLSRLPVVVAVNTSPVATASNNGPVCTGSPLILTGGPALMTYSWTGPNGFLSNQQSPVVAASAVTAMAGVYSLTVTSSNGCQSTATTTVIVSVQPIANPGTGGNECDLNFIFNAVPSVGTGIWTRTGGTGTAIFSPIANSPTATVTVSAYGSYIFTWTETNGTCVDAASIIVNFSQPPAANGGSGGNECDLNFNLNATSPIVGTGVWTRNTGPGNATFIPNANTPNAVVTVSQYGSYTFTWTVINGACSDTSNVRVNFYQQPVANAGTGGNECDLNFTFSAIPSVGTGTWTLVSGPGTAVYLPNANAPNATVTVSLYGTYTFMWTELNGICTSNATITVNFYQQPVANAGSDGNECDLDFTLSAVPGIGTGTWVMTSGPGIASFTPNNVTPNANVTVSAYGTYSFSWTELNGTCFSSDTVTINFYQQPVANAGTGGNNCGNEFNLRATPSIGTGTWTRVSGPGSATFSPNVNSPTVKVTVSVYGTYVFRWTEVNGTCSSNATVSVTFIQQPSANGGNGGDVCIREFLLNAVPGSGTGTWTKVTGPGNATFIPNQNTPNARVTVTQFGDYDFAWTEVNNFCSSTDIIRVSFHDLPLINAGADVPVCEGGSIQLSATGTGAFQWTPENLVNNPNISNPVASPVITSVFTVTLTDQYGCRNSDQVKVEVRKRPVADAGPDQVLEYQFETILDAVAPDIIETGEWTVYSGSGIFTDKNNPSTPVKGLELEENIFIWILTNGACPASTDSVKIIVNNLIIPTLITPNLDGKNDFFVINGVENLGKSELVIFNRWGAKVYENKNYDNSWDGVDENADPLPDDTYFFVFKPEKSKALTGYVVIRR